MTKSLLSEIIDPIGYTTNSFLSEIHISISNPVTRPCDNAVLHGTASFNGKRL